MKKSKCKDIEMYPYRYMYRGKKILLIWQTSECGDSFRLNSDNTLIAAQSETKIKKLLGPESKKVHWSESAEMDFDKFWMALKNLKVGRASSKKTCELLLNGWNFIEDLLGTLSLNKEKEKLKTPLLNKIYKKLFYGTNLPSVTPEQKSYFPVWEKKEIILLRKEFSLIWNAFQKKTSDIVC